MYKKDLDKKIKIYRILGAVQFQKVVFGVEKLKYKIIKKLCPNFIKHFDKYCDKRMDKELENIENETKRKQIITKYQFSKMAMRKEMNSEHNINYHMDSKAPTEIYKYLEWNKSIHKKGLIKNSIILPLAIIGVITGIPFAIPVCVYEALSTLINFECINIQNYNICRFKKIEPAIKKREERQNKKDDENYGEANRVIHKTIDNSEHLPSFEEIIANIKTPEQARQMRELLINAQETRAKQKIRGNK